MSYFIEFIDVQKSFGDLKVLVKEADVRTDKNGSYYLVAKLTDASAAESVTFFNRPMSRVGVMDFNTAHTMEHYGNLVTYMRIKGLVPPTSEPRK